ncbi:hypothetical protein [Limosilactobacillus walteri]|uniref:hypothetical protein n=1 Tax=Limosilactobacillus walteri TaxID=2268022 RepID=UPI00129D2640|nr:hypothetical protein [Limosilactobacillus walteri]
MKKGGTMLKRHPFSSDNGARGCFYYFMPLKVVMGMADSDIIAIKILLEKKEKT